VRKVLFVAARDQVYCLALAKMAPRHDMTGAAQT
jgi:hypothetical protein